MSEVSYDVLLETVASEKDLELVATVTVALMDRHNMPLEEYFESLDELLGNFTTNVENLKRIMTEKLNDRNPPKV